MATKKLYTCPYCKGEYETPGSLARCILDCEEKIKIEEEAKQKAKLAAEKEARYKEVVYAYENFEELKNKYVDDYGSFIYKAKDKDSRICDFIFSTIGLI